MRLDQRRSVCAECAAHDLHRSYAAMDSGVPPLRLRGLWSRSIVRRALIIAVHLALWTAALALALQLRFDGEIPAYFRARLPAAMLVLLVARTVTFYASGLFHGLWRYAGLPELRSLLRATTVGSVVLVGAGAMLHGAQLPRSVYVGEWLASIVAVGGVRFAIRIFRERRARRPNPNATPTLIVGAGDAGEALLRDVERIPNAKWDVVGFLDDDPTKVGGLVRGVRVLGPADEATLRRVTTEREVGLIVLAMPAASGARTREILAICRRLGIKTKTVAGLAERVHGQLGFSTLREVRIDDLLRRDPIELDVAQVEGFLEGKTILVTGGGGSIGSEIARQVLRFKPKALLLVDHDENALFHIERELRADPNAAGLVPVMADIADRERIDRIFRAHRPHVVFHAAAHKHVPMMERNPVEAVKNNVFGTMTVADAAAAHGAEAFVLISTDKAVNPTSVMGASKRVAEMIVQHRAARRTTRFVAVRFGNVLGSAGSVVPLFREQIAKGGPVLVTHPEMRRYFMTIPEASQLVLQAGALGGSGEIFVLDMGEPVRIVDLARDLIELSGFQPEIDIAIEFSGLRPGEKLFEELLHDHEAFDRTPHPKILVGRIKPLPEEAFAKGLARLRAVADAEDELGARRALSELVPEATLAKVDRPRVSDVVPAGAPEALAEPA
jgi:FlaA1/EpsC-like NDP-sugar epimerase